MQTLIWTVTVPIEAYRRHQADFDKNFVNPTEEGDRAQLEVIQRGYFRAETSFQWATETFTDLVITSSAIRPPR